MLRRMGSNLHRASLRSSVACYWRPFSSTRVCPKAQDDVSKKPLGMPYAKLTVGIPKETAHLERRVAATPESVQRLAKAGFAKIQIQDGAGAAAYFDNAAYQAAGAAIVPKDAVWKTSDIVLKVSE